MWSITSRLRSALLVGRRRARTVERRSRPTPDPEREIRVLAAGFAAFAVGAGSRVALIGLPAQDALEVDRALARVGAGCVVVPDHAGGPRLRLRLRGVSDVVTVKRCTAQVGRVAADLPDLVHVWTWDADARSELRAAAVGRMPAFSE